MDMQDVKVLFDGYSKLEGGDYYANCSCVLIKGPHNVIVDTMTPWDGDKLLNALKEENISCSDINYVVSTHGHSDHTGCNYLFKNAIHIVGFSISHKDKYHTDPDFRNGEHYKINDKIKVIPTPGHTLQDVSVIVETDKGVLAVTGDLFEKFDDLDNEYIWLSAGSDSESLQRENRMKILKMADFIVPGHGTMFEVPKKYK
ncbi:metallo-beta-lactamase domain-containing protein 1 [Diabrotica virgifera virgifera]|uniref:Metallo-beta-lactamase domain-containing protein 1 n=1 Tax=Diabrotica virgifera virgifera TaxID=50390 RepID=A0A6P7GLE7_DIAVI|nr:metallo-beta-lactamase domain-containing protein 1 [Diabrotica virgifera virgifera]